MSKAAFAGIGVFAGALGFLAASTWHGTQGQPPPNSTVSAPAGIKAASSVQIRPGTIAAKSSSTTTDRISTASLPALRRSQGAAPIDHRSTANDRPAEQRYSRRYRGRNYRKSWNERQYRRYARNRSRGSQYDTERTYKRDRWRPRRNRNYRKRRYDRYARPRSSYRNRRYYRSGYDNRRYNNRYWRYRSRRYQQARRYRPFAERRYRYRYYDRSYDRYARRDKRRFGWNKRQQYKAIPAPKASQAETTQNSVSSTLAAPLLKCTPGKNVASGKHSQSPANTPPRPDGKKPNGLGWIQPGNGRSI